MDNNVYNESFINERDVLNLAWNHFQQHSEQRISYFNFYIVFASVLTTAQTSIISGSIGTYILGFIFGLILSLTSFIFWKIDSRNMFLTKESENIIKIIESRYNFSSDILYLQQLKLFTNEEMHSASKKYMSHARAFKYIIFIFLLLGIIGSIVSLILLLNEFF